MTQSVSFNGTPSGDGECFCWNIDFETYKEFDRHWEEEIKYRKEFNLFNGYPENCGIYEDFKLYPPQILRKLIGDNYHTKKYKVTITLEEIKE